MKKKLPYRLLLSVFLVVAIVVSGCSRKKAGFTNRLYHNTTSLYNWYFNANELMRQTEEQLWAQKDDDYLKVLPVYVLPNEEEQKALYPQMDAIIDKCSTVIDRHSMEINKKEHNKWIDDNFLLIGVANYYKGKYATAQEMFSYCVKKYKGEDSRFDAALWLARTYIEQKQYNRAITVLSAVERDNSKDRPKDFTAKLETVYSDLYLRQDRYQDALPHLEDAARLTRDKKMKARLTFIMAQAYKELNNSRSAIESFAEVVKLKPEYEMEFYAKINQALAYDRRLDPQKIIDMLWDLAKDEKYSDYADQVYYALAEIEIERQNIEKGIEYLKTSAEKSVNNPRQKGMSYLRLAEIYFADREYALSKQYYDNAAANLPEDYPNYKIIVMTAASLTELVTHIQNIQYNDSILELVMLDDKERDRRILRMIVELEAEQERKKREELEALEKIQNTAPALTGSQSGSGRSWYFYNAGMVGSGFQDFKRIWGDRKLEDNWRRSIKTTFEHGPALGGDSLMAEMGQETSTIKTLEEYLAELPQTEEEIAAAHHIIIHSLYDIGTIYKERLKDDDNAIESFVRITNQYDTSAVAPQAFYQLYRIYLEKEQSGGFVGTGFKDNSDYYKHIILSDFPGTEYAKLIMDPNYMVSQNERYEAEKAIYEETYKKYIRRQYSEVLVACNTVIDQEPDNNFIPKYYLVKALTVGARKDASSYETLLREIISKFPGTDESERAAELLSEFNNLKARLAREQKAAADAETAEQETADGAEKDDATDTSMYNYEEKTEHFFALIFPKGEGDVVSLKETIADFHAEFFRNSKLRITNSFIDKDNQILIIRSFENKEDAMEYYDTFRLEKNMLKNINSAPNYKKFVISTKNFTVLFRNKNTDVYQLFFEKSYL